MDEKSLWIFIAVDMMLYILICPFTCVVIEGLDFWSRIGRKQVLLSRNLNFSNGECGFRQGDAQLEPRQNRASYKMHWKHTGEPAKYVWDKGEEEQSCTRGRSEAQAEPQRVMRFYPGELDFKIPFNRGGGKPSKFKGQQFIFPLTLYFGETTVISGWVGIVVIFNGSATDPEKEAQRLYTVKIDSHCEIEGNSKCLEHKLQSKAMWKMSPWRWVCGLPKRPAAVEVSSEPRQGPERRQGSCVFLLWLGLRRWACVPSAQKDWELGRWLPGIWKGAWSTSSPPKQV